MTFKSLLLGASLIALTACGSKFEGDRDRAQAGAEMAYATVDEVAAAPAPKMAPQPGGSEGGGAPQTPSNVQYIAYVHSAGLRLPVGAIEPTLNAHVERCKTAGPATCIVINSNYNTYSDDQAGASLSIKAKPDYIDTFLGGLEAEATAARGEISSRNTSAEDLTVQIIDTDATLKAKLTLQGRLEKLLAERPGELGDLLETEKALADVNAEIDSLKSILATLRSRVDMSELNLNYETKVNPVSTGALAPLADAFGNFFYNLARALGSVVTFFAVALPWLLVIGALLWIWLRAIWPRIRRKKPAA